MDSEGIIKYPGRYEKQVASLINKLDKRPMVQFGDFKFASLFIILLNKNNIEYAIHRGTNQMDIHVVYDIKDKRFVDEEIQPQFKKLLVQGSKTGIYAPQDYP